MKPIKLKALVTVAVELDQDIAIKNERLKELKSILVAEALARPTEQQATAAGGKAWVAPGENGCIARVSFPAPALKTRIEAGGHSLRQIQLAAGRFFERLFRPATIYRPIESFRTDVESLMGSEATKLVRLCQSESAPRVSFETKENAAGQ